MDKKFAIEIINCLPKERSLYFYYKDYYAFQLLKDVTGSGIKISDLKNSRYAKLLNKKVVKEIVARCGNNHLQATQLEPAWQGCMEYFTLTLDLWDGNESGWSQTSRRGWNLVLQLNFSNQHNSYYRKLVKPTDQQALNFFVTRCSNETKITIFARPWPGRDSILTSIITNAWLKKFKATGYAMRSIFCPMRVQPKGVNKRA